MSEAAESGEVAESDEEGVIGEGGTGIVSDPGGREDNRQGICHHEIWGKRNHAEHTYWHITRF